MMTQNKKKWMMATMGETPQDKRWSPLRVVRVHSGVIDKHDPERSLDFPPSPAARCNLIFDSTPHQMFHPRPDATVDRKLFSMVK